MAEQDKTETIGNAKYLVQEAVLDLANLGLLVDSGKRRWSERTGRYEVVWIASSRCRCGYESERCFCRDLPGEPDG
jgi:hypothetical protein